MNFCCECELASHTFLRDHAFRESRVVYHQCELRGNRHQQFAIGVGVRKSTAPWTKREYPHEIVPLSDLDQYSGLNLEQDLVFAGTLFTR